MILATQTLPENSHSGYVAAAYIVFFVLVLVYVAIMSWRLTRVERSVRELRGAANEGRTGEPSALERREQSREGSPDAAREREIV